MDLVRKDGHLDRAYRVYIFTFGWAHAVYYNVYYICTTCLATVYYICTTYLAIYYIRTACLAVYYIYTTCLAIYYIYTARLAVYYIYTAYLAVYYNIYYIRATTAISLYLTSPIYPWPTGTIKEI